VSVSATLAYSATATGPTTPAALDTAMAAVDLTFDAIEQITGCTFISDITTTALTVVTRTIVFDINTAQFQSSFPPGSDQAAPFRGLYTQTLSAALDCIITEAAVVLA